MEPARQRLGLPALLRRFVAHKRERERPGWNYHVLLKKLQSTGAVQNLAELERFMEMNYSHASERRHEFKRGSHWWKHLKCAQCFQFCLW